MGLSELIKYAYEGKFVAAKQNTGGAKMELKSIERDSYFKFKTEIKIISELIENLIKNQDRGAKAQADQARTAYINYVVPYMAKNTEQVRDEPHSKANDTKVKNPVEPTRARKVEESQSDDHKRIKQTPTGVKSKFEDHKDAVNVLANEFHELSENEWSDVHAILPDQWGEANKVGFLLQIVQEAFVHNRDEASRQIKDIEKYARVIVKDGDIKPNTVSSEQGGMKGDISLLMQFRKNNAAHAVDRLQREFRKYLAEICTKYKLAVSQCIETYGDKCVKITWWMCVQDPPMYIIPIDTRDDRVDPSLYDWYLKKGTKVEYVAWPALLRHKSGPVVNRGIAQFK